MSESPDADADPDGEVKRKLIQAEPVHQVGTRAGGILAVWRDEDADPQNADLYRNLMTMNGFQAADPADVPEDADLSGVDAEGVVRDLWTRHS